MTAFPLLPLMIFSKGRSSIVLLVALFGAACALLILKLRPVLEFSLANYSRTLPIDVDLKFNATLYAWIICGVLLIPLVVVATALPIRLIAIHNQVPFAKSLSEAFIGIFNCIGTFILGLIKSSYMLIPVIILVLGYFYWAKKTDSLAAFQTYMVAGSVVIATVFLRMLPILFAPTLSVCGQLPPTSALFYARGTISPKNPIILLQLAIWIATSGMVHYFWHQHSFNFQQISINEITVHLLISWYFLTLISITIMQAMAPNPQQQVL